MSKTIANCVAVFVAEMRTARRLPRTWLFGVLAVLVGFVAYHGQVSQLHLAGVVPAPRFALPGFGLLVLAVLLVGVVFQAFDSRARDERDRIAGTLDAMPVSNVEFIGSRVLAMAAAIWFALLAATVVLQVVGMVAASANLPFFGEPAGLIGLATLVLLDAPPLLVFWGALVVFLGALLRYGLPVLAVGLALVGSWVWVVFNTPLYLLPVVSGIAHLGLPVSDILPRLPSFVDFAQRLALLLAAGGFVCLAAARSPRPDIVGGGRRVAAGVALVALGGAGLALLGWLATVERAERQRWADAHAAQQDAARPDVQRLAGEVVIDPGRELVIDVDLRVRAPDAALAELRFSLNPGMRIDAILIDGQDAPHRHELGLLTILPETPLASGQEATVTVRAAGIPDPRFAYLDSGIRAADQSLNGAPLATLGDQASLFEAQLVVLPPGVIWLPTAGANYGAENVVERVPDFHEVDLRVRLPDGWRAAGAGRLPADPEDAGAHRFRPTVALAAFALVAVPDATFARHAATIGDIEYELLIHRQHLANVAYLNRNEVAAEATQAFFAERLGRTRPGLGYPHAVLSVVEVPAQLRRYGGGRMMETTQAQPGVQFLPEHGFPSARFEARPPLSSGIPEEQVPRILLSQLDFLGVNGVGVTKGATRNALPFLASATGEGAVVANYLVESLTERLLHGNFVAAPAHWLQPSAPNFPEPIRPIFRLFGVTVMSSRGALFFPSALEDRSEEVSLLGIDPLQSSQTVDIMIHKSNLLALSIWQLMGRSKVVELLATLRERYAGAAFTMRDFVRTASELEPGMAAFLEYSLLGKDARLPGFRASEVSVARLSDDERGQPRYQIALHVRNEEPAPGVAAIVWRADTGGLWSWSPFTHVPGESAVEIGAVSAQPPLEVRLETYLSLNRRISRLTLPNVDPAAAGDAPSFVGVRPSEWRPPDVGIVVDDLDPGFSVTSPPPPAFRFGSGTPEDAALGRGGIPEFAPGQTDSLWRRQMDANVLSWGKYRRTLVRIPAGEGVGRAVFAAELPAAGRWRLGYHLPGASVSEGDWRRSFSWMRFNDSFGSYDIRLKATGIDQAVAFDGADAVPGWNDLGVFDLPAGPVEVAVSDRTTGEVVVADAVRWQRVEERAGAPRL